LQYKLHVFDLDETLWTVSGGLCNLIKPPYRLDTPDRVIGQTGLWAELFPGVRDLLKFLKKKGVYISLASRNDKESAMRLLDFLQVADFFDYPQLCWKPKEDSIKRIIRLIQKRDSVTIKPEEVLFVDDWPENVAAVRRWGATGLRFGQDILSFEDLKKMLV
jgi:magnesium-dependent phosphatase-1